MPKEDGQFKKGVSGNPKGRVRTPEHILKVRRLTSDEYTKIATKYLFMDRAQISENIKRTDANMLELIVGGIVMKAAQKQDDKLATFILDRVIGRVKDVYEARIGLEESLHMRIVKAMEESLASGGSTRKLQG